MKTITFCCIVLKYVQIYDNYEKVVIYRKFLFSYFSIFAPKTDNLERILSFRMKYSHSELVSESDAFAACFFSNHCLVSAKAPSFCFTKTGTIFVQVQHDTLLFYLFFSRRYLKYFYNSYIFTNLYEKPQPAKIVKKR